MDPVLHDAYHSKEFSRCIQVALLCVKDIAADRPTMSDIACMLSNESISLQTPKQPILFLGRTTDIAYNPSDRREECTVNSISVSVLEGR